MYGSWVSHSLVCECVVCVLGSNCGSAFSVSFLSGVQMPLQLGWKHEENSRTGAVLQGLFWARSELWDEEGARVERPSLRIFSGRAL